MDRLLIALVFALSAHGALITADPGGVTTTISGPSDKCGAGPIGGFAYTSTGSFCGPYSGFWGLGTNGSFNVPPAAFGFAGVNGLTGSFTIDLGSSYATAGAFVNYYLPSSGPTIAAIAADGVTVLESYNLEASAPISTPGGTNAGAFRGISRSTADIRYLQFAGAAVAAHSITVSRESAATGVPEPSTLLLLAPALLFLLRRNSC